MKSRIAYKLAIAIVLLSSLITLVMTAYDIYSEYRIEINRVEGYTELIGKTYLESIKESLWLFDDNHIRILLKGLFNLPDMDRLELHSNEGYTWYEGTAKSKHVLVKEFPLEYRHKGNSITIGSLKAVIGLDGIYNRLIKNTLSLLIRKAIEIFIVSGFILLLFQYLVTRHLNSLSEWLKNLKIEKSFEKFKIDRAPGASGKNDELDEVVLAINEMRDNLKNYLDDLSRVETQLRQAQKMEAIGTLAGGIAHDFNNILNIILGYAEIAKDDAPESQALAKNLDKVLQAGHRAKDLVGQILAFSRQTEIKRFPFQPASVVKEAVKMLRHSIPSTIEIIDDIDPECGMILADPVQVHQVVMNLCTNSFHAMERSGGRMFISLRSTDIDPEDAGSRRISLPGGKYAELCVRDTGPGIAAEIQHRIFDPYFTTKEVGKGTGLGLSIALGIVQSGGGTITLESEQGKGASFCVFLPITEEQTEKEKPDEPVRGGNERILFIDDEESLAMLGSDMLGKLGYMVTALTSSDEALKVFRQQPEGFDLVITDQTMPGMTGAGLAEEMLRIRPDIPIILCTGYSTIISEEKAKAMGIREFALKPIVKRDIARLIRKALDRN